MSMMDFPNTPSVNDTYTVSGRTWRWTGAVWESVRAVGPTGYLAVINVAGTSYTLGVSDVNDLIVFTASSTVTVTLPSAAWSTGNSIDLLQKGTGQVVVAPAVGVTIRTTGTARTRDQFSAITLVCIGSNEWLLQGDTAVV